MQNQEEELGYGEDFLVADSITKEGKCVGVSLNPDSFDTDVNPPDIELAQTSVKFEVSGVLLRPGYDVGDAFGYPLSAVGDVNGDNVPDFLAGKHDAACLFSGADLSLVKPRAHFPVGFGGGIAGVGDIDGDGIPDLLAGYKVGEKDEGRVQFFSGADLEEPTQTLKSPNPEEDGRFGDHILKIGDTNGDGVSEVLIGARGEGRAYIYGMGSGSKLKLLHTMNLPRGSSMLRSYKMTSLDDVNGDGSSDFLIGDPEPAGRAYLYNGADASLLDSLISPTGAGEFGTLVAGIGDVDGGGTDDFMVGESVAVHIYSGENMEILRSIGGYGDDSLYKREGPEYTLSHSSGIGVGDLNDDGVPDVVVGHHNYYFVPNDKNAEFSKWERSGTVDVYSGKSLASADSSKVDLLQRFRSPNPQPEGHFGSIEKIGDINGDGIADLLVSAGESYGKAAKYHGRVYIFVSKKVDGQQTSSEADQ